MISNQSIVKITDNTGALLGRCIKILSPKNSIVAKEGDLILCVISNSSPQSKIGKKSLVKGIIVRTKKNSASDNAVVLVKEDKFDIIPLGTRIKGPVSKKIINPELKGNCRKLTAITKLIF